MSADKHMPGPVDVIEGRTLLHIETAATAPQPGIPVCSLRKNAAGHAWAERIVQSLNTHDELVEALTNVLSRCIGLDPFTEQQARAALSKTRSTS